MLTISSTAKGQQFAPRQVSKDSRTNEDGAIQQNSVVDYPKSYTERKLQDTDYVNEEGLLPAPVLHPPTTQFLGTGVNVATSATHGPAKPTAEGVETSVSNIRENINAYTDVLKENGQEFGDGDNRNCLRL
jgi:hypothetical protein